MSDLRQAIRDLVIANRVLAREDVVDAYGHVSVRHPQDAGRFLLSQSKSPQLVDEGDIMEFTLDGRTARDDKRPPYLERFIHGAIYEARPDVHAVIHAHAEDTLPFGISKTTKLQPVIGPGRDLGFDVPVWEIREKFGDGTNLLVMNIDQGRDLAVRLGSRTLVLMRGHGFAAAHATVMDVVRVAVYLPRNARVQLAAMRMGDYTPLSEREAAVAPRRVGAPESWRAWEYWAVRAGCAELLGKPPG